VPNRSSFEERQLKGLLELPSIEQGGMILVHPQPGGRLDFDEFFGPMAAYLEDFKIAEYSQLVSAYRAPARINWKHAVDGGLESYHTPFLHKETFGKMFGEAKTVNALLHIPFGEHHALIAPDAAIMTLKDKPESEWPHHCHFTSTNAIFPNTVIGGGFPLPILFFQRSEPGDQPGVCDYVFRLYGRPPANEMDKQILDGAVKLFMKVAIEEDMPAQASAQIMMEKGIVPSIVFGKREINLTRMHKRYDELIGHDAEKALLRQHNQLQAAE
jgi:hypothetical protein